VGDRRVFKMTMDPMVFKNLSRASRTSWTLNLGWYDTMRRQARRRNHERSRLPKTRHRLKACGCRDSRSVTCNDWRWAGSHY